MKYIIGMDGGGTKTICAISDLDGNILFKCSGGPANFLAYGVNDVSQNIFNLIEKCVQELKINFFDIKAILAGTAGGGRRDDAEMLEKGIISILHSKNIEIENIKVESDAIVALEGAFPGKPGSILIGGTGSIMFGKDTAGQTHRVGGFGRIIGDGGSGYSIGRKGLFAISKDLDGRGKHTLITELASAKFNFNSSENLIREVYKNSFDVASMSPVVLSAAEKSDQIALKIIDEESEELILHIESMIRKINHPHLDVAFIGGLISNDNIFSKLLKEKISHKIPAVNIVQPEYPPEEGAIFLAIKLFNLRSSQL